jgi:putative hydrolase
MNDFPFGFGKPDEGGDENEPGIPFGMFGPLGVPGGDPQQLSAALHQFADMLSWQGGPVNWDLAKNLARQAASGDDPSVGRADAEAVAEAMRMAELWLDAATTLPPGAPTVAAWSRAEWIENTIPTWQQLIEPVAERVVSALGSVMPSEMEQMAGPLIGVMRQMGGLMFGSQVGQAIGSLAREVVGTTDVGLPLAPGRTALLPSGVTAYAEGLGIPLDEVRIYLALREAAHQRLFTHVAWVRGRVLAAVADFARGITVDTSRMEQALGSIDPSNPEALQEALNEGMFEPQTTPEQQAALARLETLLALIEGWVEQVVDSAASPRLTQAAALYETVRRRRATGGPAEQTFGSLVGLELRPRRVREAAALWQALLEARGMESRDAVWDHPDLLPSAEDLDDPMGFVHRAELDLSSLETSGEPPTPDEPQGNEDH